MWFYLLPPQSARFARGLTAGRLSPNIALAQEFRNDAAVDVGEAKIAATVAVREPRVVEAEQMQHGRLQVVHVHRFFHGLEPELVGCAVHRAAADAATGHPDREPMVIMVSARGLARHVSRVGRLRLHPPREFHRGKPGLECRVVRPRRQVPLVELGDEVELPPLRIAVDSPMTAADHVRRITILAERNPRPLVASYALGPHCGRAEIVTRIRVADSQDVIAVAELSDGSFWMGSAHIIVTELACLEG